MKKYKKHPGIDLRTIKIRPGNIIYREDLPPDTLYLINQNHMIPKLKKIKTKKLPAHVQSEGSLLEK